MKTLSKTGIAFRLFATAGILALIAVMFTSITQASTTVTVTQSNMQGWVFVNDQNATPATGILASGPATPLIGEGSVQFTTSNASEGQIITKADLLGTQISDITTLSYSTYQNASNTSAATSLALQFNIDKDVTDGNTSWQGRMIFEPYLNNGGTVPAGTWTTWDAKAGKWWFSHSSFSASGCTAATPCTLAEIEALYPNIGVHSTLGGIVFKAGSGWTGSFNGAVDNFTVGVSGSDTIYDFDIDDVTAPAIPSIVSPVDGSVFTSANLAASVIDWTDVTDRSSPVTYVLEASNSTAVDGNGAFVSSVFNSGALNVSQLTPPSAAEAVYYVHVQATDSKGNKSPWSAAHKITVDNTAPVFASTTNVGPIEATSNLGAVVTFTNPTATDNVDTSVITTCVAPSGSTFALGTTGVICNAADTAGNTATSATFNVTVVDTTAPTILLHGADPMVVEAGTTFIDPGANAADNSGNFAASSTHSINMNVVGDYVVTYSATDASGNIATPITRTVQVRDTTGPGAVTIIAPLNNSVHQTANLNLVDWSDVSEISNPVTYVYVASQSSSVDGNGALTSPLYTSGTLSVSEIATPNTPEGVYYFQVRGTDSLGNIGAWSTPVKATVDNTAPVISVIGDNPMTIEGGSSYVEAGATVTDSIDGSFAATPSGTVNTSVVGSSTITYSATDTAGNVATPVTRTVNVIDTTAPTITVNGANPMTLEAGTAYAELGATVSDNISTPVTATATGTVSVFVPGTYTITYDAVDASGNAASSTTRTVNVVDTTAPVINIIGQNPNIVTVNNSYIDSGATAADIVDGLVSVTSSSTVDTSNIGNYAVIYTAVDVAGNTNSSTRTVMVIPPDTTAPVITILGTNPVTLEGGSTYTDAGATALDNVNGNLTNSIITSNTVNSGVVGAYSVTYNVADGAGNAATEAVRTVNVVDTTKPVLTLNGGSVITLHTGDSYTELGATVSDAVDQTVAVVIGGDTVSTSATSTFTITYNATDASGNAATQVIRTVHVVDIAVPIITLNGSSTMAIEYGSTYTEDGSVAIDDVDGDISANVVITGNVNTNILGAYVLSYNVTDSSANVAMPAVRTINVVDTTAPVIEINGSSTVSLIVGDTYVELGASSTDAVDGALSSTITGSVDANTIGTYNLVYSASDLSGNTATTSRTVLVNAAPDTVAPIITILGSNPVTITVGTSYSDEGATTTDNVDLSVPVTASGTVDVNTIGTYSVTYTATDSSGNAATSVTRTVNVVAAPVVPAPITTNIVGGSGVAPGSGGGSSFTAAPIGQVLGASITNASSATTSTVTSTSSAIVFKFNTNLRFGMKNNDVLELQKALATLGFFKVNPTGYFGKITLSAVKTYQASKGISTTGFVGILTRAALNK